MRPCAETFEAEMAPNELDTLIKYTPVGSEVQFLEIGTAAGGTAKAILESRKESKFNLAVIDTFKYFPNQYRVVAENLKSVGSSSSVVTLYSGTSDQIYRKRNVALTGFDAILIDASHKYRYVVRDVRWLNELKVGGYAFFHDFNHRFPGVVLAVERYALSSGAFEKISLDGSLLVIKKITHFRFEPSRIKLLLVDLVSRFVKLPNERAQ